MSFCRCSGDSKCLLEFSNIQDQQKETIDCTPLNHFVSSIEDFQYGLIQMLSNAKL